MSTLRRLAAALARHIFNGLIVYGTSMSCAAGWANPPRDARGARRPAGPLTADERHRFAAMVAHYDADGDCHR